MKCGEQVLILCLGGELDTGFVLPGIFSDVNPAPSASAGALHWSLPDGAVIEYELRTGALTATGIHTATLQAGNITHSGGSLSSNGKVLHSHLHPGDSGSMTGAPI